MKIKHAKMLINKIDEIAEKDGDVFIACYFSACDDKYHGTVVNADVFDYKIMRDHVSKLLVPGIVMRAKRHKGGKNAE